MTRSSRNRVVRDPTVLSRSRARIRSLVARSPAAAKSRPRRPREWRPPRGGYGGCTRTTAAINAAVTTTTPPAGSFAATLLKRRIGVGADRLNGGQAHDDNQRQHHGVFHRGRAIFRDQETLHLQSEILHCFLRTVRPPKNRTDLAPPKKLSPPDAATRTSRRPASRRVRDSKFNCSPRHLKLAYQGNHARRITGKSQSTLSAARLPPASLRRGRPYGFAPGIATGLPFRGCEAAGPGQARARNPNCEDGNPSQCRKTRNMPARQQAPSFDSQFSYPSET